MSKRFYLLPYPWALSSLKPFSFLSQIKPIPSIVSSLNSIASSYFHLKSSLCFKLLFFTSQLYNKFSPSFFAALYSYRLKITNGIYKIIYQEVRTKEHQALSFQQQSMDFWELMTRSQQTHATMSPTTKPAIPNTEQRTDWSTTIIFIAFSPQNVSIWVFLSFK